MNEFNKKRREFGFLWDSPAPNKVIVAARGSGKTVATLQYVLETLLSGKPNGSAVFFSSTLKQVKQVVTPIMRQLTLNYDSNFCKFNHTENVYRFRFEKGDVRELMLLAYENPETKRGLHPQLVVLDECASMPADMFGNIIAPMITDTDGRLIVIGTPQGHNKFYELYSRGRDPEYEGWESYMLKATDLCPSIFKPHFLFQQKNNLTSSEYAQEYECDFNANVLLGSVYGEFIDRYTLPNIKPEYTWDPRNQVYCAWDLGYNDATAIWFFQKKGDVLTFIDYYENTGKEIEFYADNLVKRPYSYKRMILPHDGAHHNLRGAPIADTLQRFGLRSDVLPVRSKKEGINEARNLLKTCRFNSDKCAFGLQRLKEFKFKINKKTGLKTDVTEHDDGNSHGADAFRYAAMAREIWNRDPTQGKIIIREDYNVLC